MACCPYTQYYHLQAGKGSIPFFQGADFQHGHGIGSIFSSLFRAALPLLKSGAKYFGKQAINTGANIVGDVIWDRKNIKESAKSRLKETGKKILADASEGIDHIGGGKGIKRKRLQSQPQSRKRHYRDIFDE